jgi:hypothetical protein
MAQGKEFNLTEKRLKELHDLLADQHTLVSIAMKWGIHKNTLSEAVKKAGIDWRRIRNGGKMSMRAMLFGSIMSIEDEAKRIEAGLKYLDRYPIEEDEGEETQVSISDAVSSLLSKGLSVGS